MGRADLPDKRRDEDDGGYLPEPALDQPLEPWFAQTAIAVAYREAEARKAKEEAELKAALEEAAREEWSAHIYDPIPYAEALPDEKLYEGTGIALLYASLGSELEGWRILPGSNRP